MKKILIIILIITLSLSVLLISVEWNSYNKKYYLNSYKSNNVYEITGKTENELSKITEDLINYLKRKADNKILEPNFNENEILHMEDVQVLYRYGDIIKYLSILFTFIIIIILRKDKKLLTKGIFYGIFANWGILLGLLMMIFINFNKYFTYFHLIFFTNDLWILDPRKDLLIQMLPEEFFINIALRIGLLYFSILAIIQLISYFFMKKLRDR